MDFMKPLKANPIQGLRRILRDQYDFHSIVKELIQNADDAKATQFHIGWMSDWPKDLHPLLCSPAIVVLNDGEFTEANAKAICCIDVGTKGGDSQVIGKFGLGMKSVFHLCEAFFFSASQNRQGAQNCTELLNPWYDGLNNIHDDWGNNLEAVNFHLTKRIKSWQHDCDNWFCLILPLRTEQQLNEKHPIVREYPTFKDFFEPDLPRQIARLMPMLRSLTSLTIWSWNGHGFSQEATIETDYETRVPRKFSDMKAGLVQGRTVISCFTHPSEPITMDFGGEQILLEDLKDDKNKNLKDDKRWPTSESFDKKTGESKDKPESAEPHCAAVFSCIPTDSQANCRLQVKHAVFLPLAKTLCEIDCKGNTAFQLLLHGHFFLDAGRKEIISSTDGQHGGLESEWNSQLIIKGVYPLILPALDEFVRFSGLDSGEVRNLTIAIRASKFYQENRRYICAKEKWLWCIGNNSWISLSTDEKFFKLPTPPDDSPNLPFEVFPELEELCQSQTITYENQPYLSTEKQKPVNLGQSPHLTMLLDSLKIDTFADDQHLSYLVKFLGRELPDNALKALVIHTTSALRELGLNEIRTHAEKFKEFVRLLGNNYCVSFSTTGIGRHLDAILSELFNLDLSRLLLPDDLSPNVGGQLSLDDADEILSQLTQIDQISLSAKSIFALQVVEKTRGTLEYKRAELGEYSVFLCRGYADEREQLFSWNKLDTLKQGQQLFAGGSSFAKPLQSAIRGVHLFRLVEVGNLQPFQILFGDEKPPSCDKATCFRILGNIYSLNAPEHRSNLLQNLQGCPGNIGRGDYLKAMRYLLHGSKEHYNDTQSSLLRTPQMEHASLLGRLAHSAMAILEDEWRWLQHENLARNLSDSIADELKIKHIDFNAIEELLEEIEDLTWLSDIGLSQNDKRTLLRRIQSKELWRFLPFHETAGGLYVSLDNHDCYYQTEGFHIPSSLKEIVTIIQRTNDAQLNMKYVQYLPSWDAEKMLEVVCKPDKFCKPDEFWMEILDALNHLQTEPPEQLKSTCWIPTALGPISPEDIIYLPEIENELTRLLADPELDGAFFSVEHIENKVKNRPEFEIVKEKLLPSRNDALEMLGECLRDIERYYIGDLDIPRQELIFILEAFKGVPPQTLPVYELLRALLANFQDTSVEEYLLPSLLQPIGIERTISCLNFLSEKHEKTSSLKNEKLVFKVHSWYLRSFIKSDENRLRNSDLKLSEKYRFMLRRGKLLEEIRLLNRNGQWKSHLRLCFDANGIDDADLLNVEQGTILSNIVSHNRVPLNAIQDDTDDDIQKYFQRWEGLLPNQVIGGFLAFLGKDYNKLAHGYLQPRDLNLFQNQIDENIQAVMEDYQFSFHFRSGHIYQVMNLIGKWFDAQVSQTYDNIFIGDFKSNCEITIREFEPENHTSQELTDLLFKSASLLISEVYSGTSPNLKKIWDELSDSGQLELEVAQELILKNAFLYLKQLGSVHLPTLWDTIQSWRLLDRRLVEVRRINNNQSNITVKGIEDKLRELSEELKKNIESDIQTETLKAVRQKMKEDFQYSRNSIPFELFQNSDDAALELAEMVGTSVQLPLVDQVNLTWDEHRLVWIHWGRQINEFRRGAISSEEGRKLGYDADLENMLFLSSSDKGSRQGKVTGKYGLGFKSVFLLTDKPKILSGQLGFEIVGGFFPKRLSDEERQRLQEELSENNDNFPRNIGTVFELVANKDNIKALPEVIKGFKSLIPILLIFARKIKKCGLHPPSSQTKKITPITWHETPVPQCQNVFTGKIRLSDDESKEPVNVVVLRGSSHSAFLMAVGTTGFEKLPDDIPTFWVTAPTTEKLKAGFAVNGPFALDIGRAQLASDIEQNDELAGQLGADFGSALIEMFRSASDDWSQFCNSLGLVENTPPYQLWYSLWNLMSKGIPNDSRSETELLKRIFWGNGCSMAHLLQRKNALPTGLPGKYQSLTHPDRAVYMAQGIIDEKAEKILPIVSEWDSFCPRVRPDNIISYSQVGLAMKRLYPPNALAWKPLKLKDIIEWELGGLEEVSVEKADRLGTLIKRNFLDKLEKKNDYSRKEREELRKVLKELHFKDQKGRFQAANDLLAIDGNMDREDDREESLRAAFAPEDRVLNSDYNRRGISFFKACRSQMYAPSQVLAEWGRKTPSTREKGIKFLRYLLEGKLGRDVGKSLSRRGLENTWLYSLSDVNSTYFNDFNIREQLQLLGMLRTEAVHAPVASPIVKKPIVKGICSNTIIKGIYRWWRGYEKDGIQRYEEQIYGQEQFPKINSDTPTNLEERTEWLKLFLYGILHSVGRTSHEANQNFVRLCTDNGWLSRLAKAHESREAWLKAWDEYIDEQIQDIKFFHWMKQLIGLFVVARRLDDYVEAFLAVNQIEKPFALSQITAPRANENFQGGGPDAPPISKVLGIGAWFIMRELVRKGIIENKNAYQHCYVPVKGVRDIVEGMGGPFLENSNREEQSILIYEFLAEHLGKEKATFNGAFDIPLQLIMEDDNLRDELFN